MPKRSRRAKSSKSITSWPKVLLIIIPVFVAAFIIVRENGGQNVLGVKDSNLFKFTERTKPSISPKPSPKPACNRVTSFSAISSSESDGETAFLTYSYTCKDGMSGAVPQVSGKRLPIEKAFQVARKECNKKCMPSKSPSISPTTAATE